MSPRGEIAHPRAPIKSPEHGAVNLRVLKPSDGMVDRQYQRSRGNPRRRTTSGDVPERPRLLCIQHGGVVSYVSNAPTISRTILEPTGRFCGDCSRPDFLPC